jgi:hypothetical protein
MTTGDATDRLTSRQPGARDGDAARAPLLRPDALHLVLARRERQHQQRRRLRRRVDPFAVARDHGDHLAPGRGVHRHAAAGAAASRAVAPRSQCDGWGRRPLGLDSTSRLLERSTVHIKMPAPSDSQRDRADQPPSPRRGSAARSTLTAAAGLRGLRDCGGGVATAAGGWRHRRRGAASGGRGARWRHWVGRHGTGAATGITAVRRRGRGHSTGGRRGWRGPVGAGPDGAGPDGGSGRAAGRSASWERSGFRAGVTTAV